MPTFSKLDKVNVLASLDINGGNISKTAEQMGVNRTSIYNWQKQLESDIQLLKMVEAAKANFANIEELTALKASAELNKRLDTAPEKIKPQDLVKIKDSGITNSRLMRGQPTAITESHHDTLTLLIKELRAAEPDTSDAELAEYVMIAPVDVPEEVRRRVAGELTAGSEKLADS